MLFSDRFRTAINVFGDSIGCAIVQHLSAKELRALDEANSDDANHGASVVPFLAIQPAANGGGSKPHEPGTFNNPTFTNELGITVDEPGTDMSRTHF